MRDINEGCGESLYIPDGEKKELKLMACIHFFSRCNCVHKNVFFMFADMNLSKFLMSHQIAVLFYWTLGDKHEQLDKKIVPSSHSHRLMLKM